MTLQQVFDDFSQNPILVIIYFLLIPLTALISGFFNKDEAHLNPWKSLYAVLIYLVCIPGIFAAILSGYTIMTGKQDIMQVNMVVYFLPVLSMIATLLIIRNRIALKYIPGFGRISGFLMVIAIVIVIMMVFEKMHFMVFFYAKMWSLGILFLILFVGLKFGWDKLFRK